MRTLKMFLIRWKACIKKPYIWVFILIAVATSLVPAVSSRFQSATKLPIGLVNEDTGALSGKLEEYIAGYSDDISIFKTHREQALRSLAMGRLEAVFVINGGFTEKVSQGSYEGIFTLYTAPASSAAQTLNEVVLNSGLSVWMEEKALLELDAFLAERGITISDAERQEVREAFDTLLRGDNSITVERHIPAPPDTAGGNDTLLAATAWYAAFSALFVIVSAGWVIDTRRKALGERMRSAGISPLSAYTGSALAIIALTMIGWVLTQTIVSVLLQAGAETGLKLLVPVLLYMAGLIGLTITISSLTSKTVQLMLIAPVFAVTQGVLCGMLLKLPDWAGTLKYLADALPGRWLMLAGDAMLSGGSMKFVIGLALCALVWLALGALAVFLRTRERKTAKE